jgi:hypothetical protein
MSLQHSEHVPQVRRGDDALMLIVDIELLSFIQ